MKESMSDDAVACAMELHYGLNVQWKVIARRYGLDVDWLKKQVYNRQRDGMKSKRGIGYRKDSLRHAAARQRMRIVRNSNSAE